jgi:hypothetical protein
MEKRMAILPVPGEMLQELLKLPVGVEIESMWVDDKYNLPRLMLKLSGPEFKIIEPGQPIPKISIFYKQQLHHHIEVHFDRWGGVL